MDNIKNQWVIIKCLTEFGEGYNIVPRAGFLANLHLSVRTLILINRELNSGANGHLPVLYGQQVFLGSQNL